jgi:hypothetical protein
MIKALSLLIATSALTMTAFAAENISVREQKVSRCKKSDQSRGSFLIKECSQKLSFNNKIVISGYSDKTENRLELLILDKRGANYYMADGVKNSSHEPDGRIEIIKTGMTDKAVVYKLNYSNRDSKDSFFRVVTVRLKANGFKPQKTCVVAIADSKDTNVKSDDKKSAQALENEMRDQAKDFVVSKAFATAQCSEYVHGH